MGNPKNPVLHPSQFVPITFALQLHRPVAELHGFVSSDPSTLQPHSEIQCFSVHFLSIEIKFLQFCLYSFFQPGDLQVEIVTKYFP